MMLLRSLIDSTMRIALSAGSPGVVQSGGRGSGGSVPTAHTVVITDTGTYAFPVGSTSRSFICIGSGENGQDDGTGGGGGAWAKTAVGNSNITYSVFVDTSDGVAATHVTDDMLNEICLAESGGAETIGIGGNVASCVGDTTHSGGNGGTGIGSGGGGGGGAGGTTGNGSNGQNGDGITAALGGTGGGGAYSGAGGDGELAGGDVGDPGSIYGGGGGGGCPNPLAKHPGAGSQGVIIAQYTL